MTWTWLAEGSRPSAYGQNAVTSATALSPTQAFTLSGNQCASKQYALVLVTALLIVDVDNSAIALLDCWEGLLLLAS